MSDFPTFDDLFRVARDEALVRNADLRAEVINRRGSESNVLAAGMAAVGDELVGTAARIEASLFLDSSVDSVLDRLVFDRYGLVRKPAAPARGSVEFSTTVAAPTAFTIPLNTRLQTSDGRTFLTTASATFPFGSVGPITVAVRSAEAGADQQAKVGTITGVLDQIVNAAPGLVVTNSLATAGADDAERDEDLRARARGFFLTVRRGTLAAIEDAALAVAGCRKATVIENTDRWGRPARTLQLVVADAFTDQLVDQSSESPAYTAQSQVFASEIYNALGDVRPAGTYVQVSVGQVVLQSVILALHFGAGVDIEAAVLQARAAVVAFVNALAPGAKLDPADLIPVLRTVAGLDVMGDEVLSPPGSITPRRLQVLRTSMSLVAAVGLTADNAVRNSTNPDGTA